MINQANMSNMSIITNWGKIMLDTTVIIKVILYKKYGHQDNLLAYELMRYLADNKYQQSKSKSSEREFFISSISIAELLIKTEGNIEKSKIIVQALDASNINILDFDEDTANVFNDSFADKLGVRKQNEILLRWGEKETKNNRQALTNDIMILGSAIHNEVDTVICADKGMYRVGRECGLNMVYIKEEYFNRNVIHFFTYDHHLCDNELLTTVEKHRIAQISEKAIFDYKDNVNEEDGNPPF